MYKLVGFQIYRLDAELQVGSQVNRSPYGLVVFSKVPLNTNSFSHYSQLNSTRTVVELVVIHAKNDNRNKELAVVGVYVSPQTKALERKSAMSNLFSILNTLDVQFSVMLGDVNVDLMKAKNSFIGKLLAPRAQVISVETTDYHSTLDHIYSDLPVGHLKTGTLVSYFSDHKPV